MLDFLSDLSDWAVQLLQDEDIWQFMREHTYNCTNAADVEDLLIDYGFAEQLLEY